MAWILAEYPNCESCLLSSINNILNNCILVVPIPGSRSIARLDENAKGAEIKLAPEYVKEIRQLATEADNAAGLRYAEGWFPEKECLKLEEWKGEQV